jgi:hypothetical protein
MASNEFFNRQALKEAITRYFSKTEQNVAALEPPATAQTQKFDEVFGEKAYWLDSVSSERFQSSLYEGILYRPEIVDDICHKIADVLTNKVAKSLMIKGPQGIGKSHSLVNVVLKVQSTGEYLVTVIPVCETWILGSTRGTSCRRSSLHLALPCTMLEFLYRQQFWWINLVMFWNPL